MVADRDRNGDVITLDQDVDRMAFTVLDGVDKQIAEDAFDPPGIDLGLRLAPLVHVDLGVVALREPFVRLHHASNEIAQIHLFDVELRRTASSGRSPAGR